MSYLEKKYKNNIDEIFKELNSLLVELILVLNKKSVQISDDAATMCAGFNKKVNVILKQYYPEIKSMDAKLEIKCSLKFYYDLIDKLTDFVRNIENYQKIDDAYYESIIDFIGDKEILIAGKYRTICSQELTAFYDPTSREQLEKIMMEKIESRHREYFTFGSLEEEIKKIAKVEGATQVRILSAKDTKEAEEVSFAESIISFLDASEDEILLAKIGNELKNFLTSKGYTVKVLPKSLITDAKLLPDR